MSEPTGSPAPGGSPPGRPRKKRGQRPRDRDWMGAATTAPSAISPGMRRLALFGVLGIAVIIGAGRFAAGPSGEVERVFTRAPVVATGTDAAENPEIAEKRKFAESLFGPEFWDAEDATDFAEEPGWAKAVLVMANLDPEFVVDHLDFSLNLHYDEVMKNPAAYRGQFVRVRGIVAKGFGAKKLDTPVGGRGDVYRGGICDPDLDSSRTIFDVLDPPPPFQTIDEAVDVDGVFYRTLRYESRTGVFVEVPWVIARTVVPRNREPKTSSTTRYVGLFVAFLALVGSIVYLVRGSRRRKAASNLEPVSFRAMFDQRIRNDGTKEPPAPPGPGV